jgi:DNA-binding MarR family transcriptional regulator
MGIDDAAVAEIERALTRIRRSQSRRRLGHLAVAAGADPEVVVLVPALDAIAEATGSAAGAKPEVSVGVVGERLGVDASNASRVVARAVAAGLVARVPSPVDGRRASLDLTPKGRDVVEAVQRQRRGVVARATAGWNERDRAALARLLGRLLDDIDTLASRESDS